MIPEAPRLMPTTPRLHRLAFYMIGLSIGLMMVGLIVSLRSQYMHQPDPTPPNGAAQGQSATPSGAQTPGSASP